MKRVVIELPDATYEQLMEEAAATGERSYNPARYVSDLVVSDLAVRHQNSQRSADP